MKRAEALAVCALLSCACGGAEPASDPGSGPAPAPIAGSGTGATRFSGSYAVPVEPALEAAASFAVDEIRWVVSKNAATLTYDLPLALIGAKQGVSFSGAVSGGAAHLVGEPGTADCTIEASAVVCKEVMPGLLPLEPDLRVVEAMSQASYSGPVADRLQVAQLFVADPIGIVQVDLSAPLADSAEAHTERD